MLDAVKIKTKTFNVEDGIIIINDYDGNGIPTTIKLKKYWKIFKKQYCIENGINLFRRFIEDTAELIKEEIVCFKAKNGNYLPINYLQQEAK